MGIMIKLSHALHPGPHRNIEAFGWFCGPIRTFVENKRMTAIADVHEEGAVFGCTVPRCEEPFSQKHSELL
jgi:hypothetical protein